MSSPKRPWSPLTHEILSWAREFGVRPGTYGLGLSGGRDSVLLLEILLELAGALDLKLVVLHVHHGGPSENRSAALRFCTEVTERHRLGFYSKSSEANLESEEAARNYRHSAFQDWSRELSLEGIFLGHHADDLLETRLLRLIRGTGPQGLNAMQDRNDIFLRPFLRTGRGRIHKEVLLRKIKFFDDVTNSAVKYQRNWLRNVWLPELEARTPGSVQRLAESLDQIVEVLHDSTSPHAWPKELFLQQNCLSRQNYLTLTPAAQRRCLASLLKWVKGFDYSAAQIREIQKRLDNSQNEHTFNVAGLRWSVDRQKIQIAVLVNPSAQSFDADNSL